MSEARVKELLKQREGMRLEFKKATVELPSNLFESICAMLNRDGGDILLGVNNDGTLSGIEDSKVAGMMANISNLSNNIQKLNPPFILFPKHHIISSKNIIHIQVPTSSQLHQSAGFVYDRSNDGDFRAQLPHQIAMLHNHKRNFYAEGIIYPKLQFSDFNQSLFPKVRQLMRSHRPDHPWLALDDKQMLEKAGLWRKDFETGEEGYTLGAILLFGKDEVIRQILPHYKIDALVRIENLSRYDDRLYIDTNLIDAYEQLMGFIEKHLPDKFFLQGDQRVSLRSQIFREIVANLIIHREYTHAQPCTFVILKDKVVCQNANNAHGEGPIDPLKFIPFPKNPSLAKFFIQLGRVDELGSGVLNVYRLTKAYGGKGTPSFIEGSVFSMEIPIPPRQGEGLNEENEGLKGGVEGLNEENEGLNEESEGLNEGATAALVSLVKAIKRNPGIQLKELSAILDNRPIKTMERQISNLIAAGLVERMGSKKTGGYFLKKQD